MIGGITLITEPAIRIGTLVTRPEDSSARPTIRSAPITAESAGNAAANSSAPAGGSIQPRTVRSSSGVSATHAMFADSKPHILEDVDTVLEPGMTIKEAVLAFDRAEAEALAVVNSYSDRRVIGLLTESFALRRYAAELERRRNEMIGDM